MNSRFFVLAHDMLCIATPDGTYLHVNPAWTRVLGWPSGQLEGRSYRDFVHPDDLSDTEVLLDDLESGQHRECFRARLRAADGSYRVIDFRTAFDASATEVLAAGRDVTEEVAMQRRLVAREQKLTDVVAYQSQEREELVGRLAGELHDSAVQHNVAALMFLDAAAGGSARTEDAAEQVRLSLVALRRIMEGLDAVDDGSHDLEGGSCAIAREVAAQFDADIRCEVHGARELPEAARRTVYRVVREGLVNACKHAGAGPIRVAIVADSDDIRVDVHDPGSTTGSTDTVDDVIGLGRGLLLLDARIRSHGGELSLDTSPDGSTLRARIPLGTHDDPGTAAEGRA